MRCSRSRLQLGLGFSRVSMLSCFDCNGVKSGLQLRKGTISLSCFDYKLLSFKLSCSDCIFLISLSIIHDDMKGFLTYNGAVSGPRRLRLLNLNWYKIK